MTEDDNLRHLVKLVDITLNEQREKLAGLDLDSAVLVEIPQPELDAEAYRKWLISEVEWPWMTKFNGNENYYPRHNWNEEEGGIGGYFSGVYFPSCKLYHQDGTMQALSPTDLRGRRGFLIRDHYTERDVMKVHAIADNLCVYLVQRGITHKKIARKRDKDKTPIEM